MSNRQRIVLLLIAAVVLAGGVALAIATGGDDEEPRRAETSGIRTVTGEDGTRTTREPPQERVEAIAIEGGRPAGEARTLRYERGDTIALRFRADRAEEVHIHGFDETVQVPNRGAAVTRFKANIEGIFDIEAHRTGEVLAKLEIRPK
ncbi:MAG TPA: hypothetical protein VHF89_17510 [Solirubrobacteraceae bacterium]|nr:hypothetical protein [Solirubrobacteraceae bacterium]